MEAASRRAARESERRWKAQQKAQMIAGAEDAVAEWREHLRDIVSLHINPSDDVDWREIKARAEPSPPIKASTREDAAVTALDQFQPRFFDFLSGGSERRRQRLADAVAEGQANDEAEYQRRLAQFEQEHSDWQSDRDLATRLLAGDVSAERDIISEMKSWKDDGLIGTQLSFSMSEEFLHAVAHVHGDDVVPTYRRKQLQSGKLSETKCQSGSDKNSIRITSVALR